MSPHGVWQITRVVVTKPLNKALQALDQTGKFSREALTSVLAPAPHVQEPFVGWFDVNRTGAQRELLAMVLLVLADLNLASDLLVQAGDNLPGDLVVRMQNGE
jgi:hypothetical protein